MSDNVAVRRVDGYGCLSTFSQQLERTAASLCDQLTEIVFGKRAIKIVDLVVIDAVFTKQRRQIAARRSGRFFIHGNLVFHGH